MKLYQSLQLITLFYCDSFSQIFWPGLTVTFGLMAVVSTYTFVKFIYSEGGLLLSLSGFFVSVLTLGCQLFLLTKAANVFSQTTRICQDAGVRVPGRKIGCDKRKPFGIHMGSYYTLTSSTPLTFIFIVSTYTMSLLVSQQ
jgi:hypothetical protein